MAELMNENEENSQKKASRSILDHFTNITNENEAKRLKNGVLLIKHLCTQQKDDKDNELKYALDRLIRGLGSSRNSARIGFYSTLVTLLNAFPTMETNEILQSIKKQLQTGGSNSKSENGDIYTGQVLACGAFIRSEKFFKSSAEEQKDILELLLNAGRKRSYLTLAATTFTTDLLNLVDENQFVNLIWPTLKVEVLKPWSEQTIDSIFLLISIQKKFPQNLKGSTLKKNLGTRELFCEENIKPLGDILLNIAALSSLKHPVYPLISKEIATSSITTSFVGYLDLQLARLNRNKLLAVSIMISNMLPNLQDHSQIPKLLTNNFVRQTLQYFRNHYNNNHDEEFQVGMMKFFDLLGNCLKTDQIEGKIKVSVLKIMLFYPGTFMIENITKSRILQQIVHSLDLEGVKKLSKLYKEVLVAKKEKVVQENTTEPWLNAERVYAAQLLVKLLSHPCTQNEIEWKMECLKLLMNLSIVNYSKYTNVGAELAGSLRDIFFRALDLKFSKLEDMRSLLFELIDHLKSLITPENYEDVLRVSLTEEEINILQQVYATTKKLHKSNDENKYNLVFQILFLQMGLQIFKDKDLAVTSLKELFMCYERVKTDKKNKKNETVNEDDPAWIEVVVDLFLNLLSHNSHLLRSVICSVFPYLCKFITPSSIHQILSVLDPKNETNPLSNADSDESGSEESDESDDEEGKCSDEEESEGESESNDEFQENETVNDKLRMAVRQALGKDGYQTDEESLDLDEMSDSEGKRLDGALAQAFKQFKPNRGRNNKKQSKNDETLTHFRVRVLDLIEVYIDSEPAMLSCLEVMLPLLQTLEFTIRDEHQKPLQMRVKSCLKKLTNLKKFSSTEGVTENVLSDILNSLLGKGTKNTMMIQDMSTEISECCVFIIKCLQVICSADGLSKKTKHKLQEKIIEILLNAVNIYFDQRDCLIPYSLFKSTVQLNWDGNLKLIPLIYKFTFNTTTRPFRRSQALELLKLFYLNRRFLVTPETFKLHLAENEEKFCKKVIETLEQFCENPKSVAIKERFIYHIFNLLKAIVSHPIKNEDIDWKGIGEKIREYRSYVKLSKDTKTAYNQLCAKLNVPNVVKMKHQIIKLNNDQDEDNENANKSEQPQKEIKRKEIQNTKKLKKEARKLRIEGMSEGFSSFSFSSVNIDDKRITNGDDISDEENDAETIKQKRRLNNEESQTNSEHVKPNKVKHRKVKNNIYDDGRINGQNINNKRANNEDEISHKKKKVKKA